MSRSFKDKEIQTDFEHVPKMLDLTLSKKWKLKLP